MKDDWRHLRLHEVAEVFDGPHATPKTIESGPIFLGISALQDGAVILTETRHVSPEDFAKWTRRVKPSPGDVVFSYETRLGQAAVIPDGLECCLGRRMGLVRFNTSAVEPWFFLYQYLSPQFRAYLEENTIRGATVDRISIKDFPNFSIALPALTEQRRIVAILDEAFEAIATAKANAEKNLQNARELAEVLTETCFNGLVNERVHPRELAALCELIVDCEHKTAPTQRDGYPSIRTPNIGKGRLILDDVNRVSEETYVAWTRRAVPLPGDLILAREAPAGNVAVIPEGMRVCLGQRTVLIRPQRQLLEPEFLARFLLQRSSQQRLLAHSRGATVQHVNLKDIRAFQIDAIPSLEVQRRVIEELDVIDGSCRSLELVQKQKLAALAELKQSLLHQAFTGALTARTADQQLAAAA